MVHCIWLDSKTMNFAQSYCWGLLWDTIQRYTWREQTARADAMTAYEGVRLCLKRNCNYGFITDFHRLWCQNWIIAHNLWSLTTLLKSKLQILSWSHLCPEPVGDILGVDVLAEFVDDLKGCLLLGIDLALRNITSFHLLDINKKG